MWAVHISELLHHDPPDRLTWPSGLPDVDDLTGGFGPGQLWVLTGEPGGGKTTLLTQWAHALAVAQQLPVALYGHARDGLGSYRRRLMECAAPGRRDPAPDDAGLRRLSLADLEVESGGWALPDARSDGRPWCLLLDDPEFKKPPVLDQEARDALRGLANAGNLVILTSPPSLVLDTASRGRTRLREEWASSADVVLELRITGHESAELVVLQNRGGRCGTALLARASTGLLGPAPWGPGDRSAEVSK